MKNPLMEDMHFIRKNDVYLTKEIEEVCRDSFFPKTTLELALNLSNVTSSFYGLALKNVIEQYGESAANAISEKIFYDLGRIKTQQCKSKLQDFPNDTRAFAYVIVSAIYNSSPEFIFEIIQFSSSVTEIKLNGVDRYLRVLSQLEIDQYIKYPTLNPFMDGIRDELQLDCNIDFQSDMINKTKNRTSTTYKFSTRR